MPPRPDPGSDQASLLAALSAGPTRRSGGGARRQGHEGRGPLYWLPVVLALGLFAQVALLGLKPTLRESARLQRAEDERLGRWDVESQRAVELDRILRAQEDPIYLERERRLLQSPESGPLGR